MGTRQIRFYEIVTKDREHIGDDLDVDDLLSAVLAISIEDAYVKLNRLEVLGSVYVPPRGAGAKGRVPMLVLDRIDRDVRLRIENKRAYRPLKLGDDETLAEPTFFSIFPRNVLGVLRNSGTAPGVASLRDYINASELLSEPIEIVPLADKNAMRALLDVESLTKFEFAVGTDVNLDVFGQGSMIARTVRAVRAQLGNVAVSVSIKIAPTGQGNSSEIAREEVQAAVTSPEALGALEKAKMHYRRLDDGRADSYDFVTEAIAQGGDVDLDPDTEKPTAVSASEALFKLHNDLYDDIVSALNSTS